MGVLELALILAGLFAITRWRRPGQGARDVTGLEDSIRDLEAQLDVTQRELEQQRMQVGEIAERLDFVERRLAQAQEPTSLPPADVP